MAKRVQSPSSINIYKQCPRKYYYLYIKKLKTLHSIHLIRGRVVHTVLENIYDVDMSSWTPENISIKLSHALQSSFLQEWQKSKGELQRLPMTREELAFYFEESMMMLSHWASDLVRDIHTRANGKTIQEAFKEITPIREKRYVSEQFDVQGFIDIIEDYDNKVRLMDYKTSKKFDITPEYELQLAIYALLYFEMHGEMPDEVGIYFLKNHLERAKVLKVDEALMDLAREEIMMIHENTISDHIADYPKRRTPLCKWRTGQCDFYEMCFAQRTLKEYKVENGEKEPRPDRPNVQMTLTKSS